jgi:hypothetical protein
VRHTFVGVVLNGRRTLRQQPAAVAPEPAVT